MPSLLLTSTTQVFPPALSATDVIVLFAFAVESKNATDPTEIVAVGLNVVVVVWDVRDCAYRSVGVPMAV